MNFRNRLIIGACIGVIIAALHGLDIGAHLEELTTDFRLRHRPARECAAPVRLVVVDDDDIAKFGQWPIPRGAHADVLQVLDALGTKHVAMDILFTEASRDPEQDQALTSVVNALDHVTLAYQFDDVKTATQQGDADSDHFIEGSRYGIDADDTSFLTGLRPQPPFTALDTSFASVNAKQTSVDEIMRHVPLFIIHKGKFYPGLAMQTVIRTYGLRPDQIRIKPGVAVTLVDTPEGTINIPIDEHGQIRINYGLLESLSKATRTYSDLYAAAMDPDRTDVAREHFADTTVVVGNASSGNSDVVVTPMGRLPGVAVQAMALENLLSGRHLRDLSPGLSALAIVALPILFAMFMRPLNAGRSVFLFLLMIVLWAWSSWQGIKMDIILPFVAPVAALTTTLLVILPTQMLGVYARFSRYIPTSLRTHLLANQPLSSGSSRAELTVFFSDIRGFTEWVEQTEPDVVAFALNEYLAAMADVAEDYGGTLDKFIGDCVMVFFGAPTEREDHAQASARMAWAMQARIGKLNQEWSREGRAPMEVGMGINTDYVTYGNFGSHRFQDFTAIGRGVNLAARIESIAPGGVILLTRRTQQLVRNIAETRLFAEVMLKGIAHPVAVYELLSVDGQSKEVQPAIWSLAHEDENADEGLGSGPYPLEGLRVMLNTGRITPETEVIAQDCHSTTTVAVVLDIGDPELHQ